MESSGVMDIQSHTYDLHQWAEGEAAVSGGPVRESAAQLEGESDLDYIKMLSEDIAVYQKEYTENMGYEYNVLSYPSGKYSVLSEVTAAQNGIKATLTIDSDRKNTIVKGLPQTLFALARFNVTEETTEEELLEKLQYRMFS